MPTSVLMTQLITDASCSSHTNNPKCKERFSLHVPLSDSAGR